MTFRFDIHGELIDLMQPKADKIDLRHICHSLSQINRWAGGTRYPFPVSSHSVLVSQLMPTQSPRHRLVALLHDAPEAYFGDIIKPTKRVVESYVAGQGIPDPLKVVDDGFLRSIYCHFHLEMPTEEEQAAVHRADLRAMATEHRYIVCGAERSGWKIPVPAAEFGERADFDAAWKLDWDKAKALYTRELAVALFDCGSPRGPEARDYAYDFYTKSEDKDAAE